MAALPLMKLIRLKGVPILQQLHLEERLLRTSPHNWCIINDGTNLPHIVMGISGKPAELLEINSVLRDKVPVIRRFSGGGTVIVDTGTIFVTFICNKDDVSEVQPYPRPIMSWNSLLYSKVFQGVGDFVLRENDYAFGNRKFGENAQSITKNRWIHHTSFLWDYEINNMAYLKLPKRAPEYRLESLGFHMLHERIYAKDKFHHKTVDALQGEFSVETTDLEAVESPPNTKFIHSSKILTKRELEEAALG
ncbi:hypothetical protein DCAR_0414741 [Daucus carota subsp. sativus]|uniref:Uncharacterized protein n=1 Tax=Daucus carota subsp. sativus TaxID=79200 RepID=A0A164ZZS2_DAUCS|nr:hypothetical protein DCAR_0414741 [Daucus carota subsp. sativus]